MSIKRDEFINSFMNDAGNNPNAYQDFFGTLWGVGQSLRLAIDSMSTTKPVNDCDGCTEEENMSPKE